MPVSPTPSTSVSRPDLADSFMEFDMEMDRMGFITTQVLPIFEAPKASGTFGIVPIEQLLQNRETGRAPGGAYSRGNFTFTELSWLTKEHGAEEIVDDNAYANYREFFDAELIAAKRAYDAVLRNQEKRTAALLFNATTWTGSSLTTAVSTEWSTAASATPITDVLAAGQKVWDGTGMWPNALVINRRVFRNLRNCAQVIDRIAGAGAGSAVKAKDISAEMLAQVFDLDYVIVAGSAKNTAVEGQTASLSQVWDNEYAMVCKIATTNDIAEPCVGRTFHWSEDGSQPGGQIEQYREESHRGNVIRVRHQVQEKVLYTEMGHLLSNITA